MHLLTPENTSVSIDLIPDHIEEDFKYSVLDISNNDDIDFFFTSLGFLESYNAPAIILQIGEFQIKMPYLENPNDWRILIGEPEVGHLEAVSLEDINSRNFSAFQFNPLTSFRPSYLPIRVVEIFPDVNFFLPSMQPNNILTVPLSTAHNPPCVYLLSGIGSRKFEYIDIDDIL